MLASSTLPAPSLVPLMRYRDVSASIEWLCTALGFEKQVAVSDPDGEVYYAQLTYGQSLIMLGSVRDSELDKLMRQPDEVGGIETQSCYLVVDDADAHYARATAAGAEIVLDLKSDGLGRRGYSCKDPEGHIWNFGTYNPWKATALPAVLPPEPETRTLRRSVLAAGMFAAVVAALGGAWWAGIGLDSLDTLMPPSPQQAIRTAPDAAQPAGDAALREGFAALRAAKDAAEVSAEAVRKDLGDAQAARTAAEGEAQAARADLERERQAKDAALRNVQELESKLTAERSAKDAAGRAAAEAKLELEKERMAREARERSGRGESGKPRKTSSAEPPAKDAAPDKGAGIETSATGSAAEEKAQGAGSTPKSVWTVASEGPDASAKPAATAKRTQRRRSLVRTPVIVRYKPTYVVDMRDVPWPYSAWYRRR